MWHQWFKGGLTWELVGCTIELAWDMNGAKRPQMLLTPKEEMAAELRRERRPPWWLMYATVAVLSVRTSTCFSCSSVLKWRRASHTASNSRQLICHCSWSPVQSPAAACPLHMAPQPVVETSVDTTTCLDTCARGTPARRKARSDHVLKVWRQDGVTKIRYVPWRHAYLGTRSWS